MILQQFRAFPNYGRDRNGDVWRLPRRATQFNLGTPYPRIFPLQKLQWTHRSREDKWVVCMGGKEFSRAVIEDLPVDEVFVSADEGFFLIDEYDPNKQPVYTGKARRPKKYKAETYKGKTVNDMPGGDEFTRSCNFFHYKRDQIEWDEEGNIIKDLRPQPGAWWDSGTTSNQPALAAC